MNGAAIMSGGIRPTLLNGRVVRTEYNRRLNAFKIKNPNEVLASLGFFVLLFVLIIRRRFLSPKHKNTANT